MSMMQVTFLGTGTSTGIPQIGCTCPVCTSTDPRDSRLRTSAIVEIEGKNILIDCGPDFRQQMLRFHIKRIDAVLVTHIHYDHTGGIDDLRPFGENGTVPIYLEPSVAEGIRNRLPYCFADHRYPGVPNICLQEIGLSPFLIAGIEIVPIRVMHYKLPIFAFRIGDFGYITDANYVSDASLVQFEGCKVLVVNGLQINPHISHFSLDEALQVLAHINPKLGIITHISHHLGLHQEVSKCLPSNVILAYDGLSVKLGTDDDLVCPVSNTI